MEVIDMKKLIVSMILMVTGTLVFGQNLDTYSSYLEIVSANPRAAWTLDSSLRNVNLDRASSRLGTQFNVFVEEGLEQTWERLKSAYNLNPPRDWVLTGLSKQVLIDYFAMAVNMDDANILFITRAHAEYFAVFRQSWAVFVQDPKGILKKK
jgi:hypothetical protein